MPGISELTQKEETKLAAKVVRDADYRIAALYNAVTRAGQDGGTEGVFDVLRMAEVYYGWLVGSESEEQPHLEAMLKGEKPKN